MSHRGGETTIAYLSQYATHQIVAISDPKEEEKKLLNRFIFRIQKEIKLFRILTTIYFARREAQSTGNVRNIFYFGRGRSI